LAFCTFVFAASSPTKDLVERFTKVESALNQNDFRKASQFLAALVRDYGKSNFSDELRFGLAECYFNLGNYEQSRAEFIKILDRPQFSYITPEAMYGLAISSIMLGDFRKAEAALEKLSKSEGYEKDARANFARGVLYYFKQGYKEAIIKLEGLTDLSAKFYLAKSYAKLGKTQEALLAFKNITSAAPNTQISKLAHFAAGEALFENKDFAGARAKFEFFLENFPFSELSDFAHYFLGCALIAQGYYGVALEHLKPLTKHPNNLLSAHANYFIGYCKTALSEPQEAITYFQRVRANYPKTRVAQYANLQLPYAILTTGDTIQTLIATSQLSQMFVTGDLQGVGNYFSGVVCFRMADYRRAAQHFENIIIKYPKSPMAEPACALLLLSLNSSSAFERAITLGAKYLKDYPDRKSSWRGELLYFLAEGYYYFKKYSEAESHYLQSQETKSDITPYARLGRAFCLYHLGRLSEAETEFRELLLTQIQDTAFTINAFLGYGYSFFNQKKYMEALEVFEALVKQFPVESLAVIPGFYYSGLSYFRLGYYGQAVDAWVMLFNQYPLHEKAAEGAFRAGDLYFKAREYAKAISTFRFIVEKHPNSLFGPGAQALIAQCFYNQKKFIEAIREYQKFLDLYPQDVQAAGVRKSLEMSYYQAGQENPVVMQEFLTRFPESELAAEAQFDKAKKLFDVKAYEQAAVEFQKVVVNFLNSEIAGDAQLLTAESYANIKRWAEAQTGYQKFLEYFPNHPQRPGAYFNLGTALFNLGDFEGARLKFQVVVDSFPNSEFATNSAKNIEICLKKVGFGKTEKKKEPTETTNEGGTNQDASRQEGGVR
jgi:TolA-binding protein